MPLKQVWGGTDLHWRAPAKRYIVLQPTLHGKKYANARGQEPDKAVKKWVSGLANKIMLQESDIDLQGNYL